MPIYPKTIAKVKGVTVSVGYGEWLPAEANPKFADTALKSIGADIANAVSRAFAHIDDGREIEVIIIEKNSK